MNYAKIKSGASALFVGRALRDYYGPYDFYRSAYEYTECGPSIGFAFAEGEVVYCDDLFKLGSWEDLAHANRRITAILVSSIVEGSDAEVPTIAIPAIPLKTLHDRVFDAIGAVNAEACRLWKEANDDGSAEEAEWYSELNRGYAKDRA